MDGIPDDFEFTLLPDDWDQFEILMENALHRIPALQTAEIRQFVNGPESFTPDSHYILGEAPELKNYYVGAGFNSMGIASAGGAGMALAEWVVNGEPTMDLWPVDIRRFAKFQGNDKWLSERVSETLGEHYTMPWPNKEMKTARPFRRSPIYHLLEQKGACFGSKMGWERAVWFANEGQSPENEYGFGRQNWFENRAAEHKAAREAVVIFDQTSFSKFVVEGRNAEAVLQRICANNVAVEPGACVYTGMLNERGGYESDLTVTRLAENKYFMVSGSAQTTRDMEWITRNIPNGAHCVVTNMSSAYAVFGVMGPNARKLLSQLTDADLGNEAFPFSTMQEISIGYATVWAVRMTYVGELGWELYVPAEFAVDVYEEICAAGVDLGLKDGGYYAMDSLRIEKGFRAWGHELTPDYTPFQAGLSFAVDFDKDVPFIGQKSLETFRGKKMTQRVLQFTLNDPEPILWGSELIMLDGQPVGKIDSGSYGHTLGTSVGLGYVRHEDGVDKAMVEAGGFEVNVAGKRFAAKAHLRTPLDPKAERVKA